MHTPCDYRARNVDNFSKSSHMKSIFTSSNTCLHAQAVWLVLSQLLFLLLIVYTKTSRKVSASPGLLKSDYRVCIPANTLMTRRQENSQENMDF